jgi:hypothetical protein
LHHITANIIYKLLNENTLIAGIEVFFISIIIILGFTYGTLYLKKKKFVYQKYLHKNLEDWLSTGIIEDADKNVVALPTLKFLLILKNPILRQLTINELLALKRTFWGDAAKNITVLYVQLGLKDFSLKKMKSNKWHVKARAIQELYLMQQREALPRIYKNVNSQNEFIRMEAQIGIIHLIGFDGLRFLNVINNKLTEWQQIKLLDQLAKFPLNEDILAADIPKWLRSPNETVIMFAMKLVDRYHRYSEYDNVSACLTHENEQVRKQAVNTLFRISNDTTPQLLVDQYDKETYFNKLNILNQLEEIATHNESEFLTRLLQEPNDTLKLRAARILAKCHSQGLRTLEHAGELQPIPYQQIYLHIKGELAR